MSHLRLVEEPWTLERLAEMAEKIRGLGPIPPRITEVMVSSGRLAAAVPGGPRPLSWVDTLRAHGVTVTAHPFMRDGQWIVMSGSEIIACGGAK